MKRINLFLLCISIQILSFAQRERLMPEDYSDYDSYNSSGKGEPILYFVLVAILIIGVIWFKIALDRSRKEEIKNQTPFITKEKTQAFLNAGRVSSYNYNYGLTEYFKEVEDIVLIPENAKCIILEYVPRDHSFVKVKFENFSTPLYVPRWRLKTLDSVDK